MACMPTSLVLMQRRASQAGTLVLTVGKEQFSFKATSEDKCGLLEVPADDGGSQARFLGQVQHRLHLQVRTGAVAFPHHPHVHAFAHAQPLPGACTTPIVVYGSPMHAARPGHRQRGAAAQGQEPAGGSQQAAGASPHARRARVPAQERWASRSPLPPACCPPLAPRAPEWHAGAVRARPSPHHALGTCGGRGSWGCGCRRPLPPPPARPPKHDTHTPAA